MATTPISDYGDTVGEYGTPPKCMPCERLVCALSAPVGLGAVEGAWLGDLVLSHDSPLMTAGSVGVLDLHESDYNVYWCLGCDSSDFVVEAIFASTDHNGNGATAFMWMAADGYSKHAYAYDYEESSHDSVIDFLERCNSVGDLDWVDDSVWSCVSRSDGRDVVESYCCTSVS